MRFLRNPNFWVHFSAYMVLAVFGFGALAYSGLITRTPYATGTTITAGAQNANEDLIAGAINGNIDTANIEDDSILGIDIKDLTIDTADLAADAVTGAKIDDDTVTGGGGAGVGNIANETVTSWNILNETILSGDILDGTITGTDIANNTITTANMSSSATITPTLHGDLSATITAMHSATSTIVADDNGFFNSGNVEGALWEIADQIGLNPTAGATSTTRMFLDYASSATNISTAISAANTTGLDGVIVSGWSKMQCTGPSGGNTGHGVINLGLDGATAEIGFIEAFCDETTLTTNYSGVFRFDFSDEGFTAGNELSVTTTFDDRSGGGAVSSFDYIRLTLDGYTEK